MGKNAVRPTLRSCRNDQKAEKVICDVRASRHLKFREDLGLEENLCRVGMTPVRGRKRSW